MSKVRINDLARELEVKSKPILDALIAVGVTEKKTHSSSIEEDEAEKVRAYFARGSRSAAPSRPVPEAKPAFSLANVSKPGDAMKAILERKQAEQAAKYSPHPAQRPAVAAPPVVATPARPTVTASVAANAPVIAKPVPAAPTQAEAPAPRRIVPLPRPQGHVTVAAPRPAVVAKPPVVVAPPPAIASAAPSAPVAVKAADVPLHAPAHTPVPHVPAPPAPVAAPPAPEPVAAAPEPEAVAAPTGPAAPAPRRVVMPQTGPRPTYSAPPPPVGGPPRRPIFERPRPGQGGPGGGRPGFSGGPSGGGPGAPGARRPMHPTRTFPGGPGGAPGAPGSRPGFAPGGRPGFPARPGFGARPGGPGGAPVEGGAPPSAPRPARPGQRRGNQRYEKTKEGPMKGFAPPSRFGGAQIPSEPLPITRTITVTEGISVKDLAEKLDIRGKDLIATLLMKGVFVTVNQTLDGELVKEVSRQFGADAQVISVEEQLENEAIEGFLEDTSNMVEVVRAPVVTIMGHVDHGKTSLLDAIRSTDVAGGEAGGITQHIGAYKVHVTKPDSPAFGREIVFLDTPGHEAFTRMRARGAKVTDIVVIVVAADDGVMPQTIEAIDHAKAAKVPIIVAVNKIDKPDANPDRVKKQLADRGLVPEEWAGSGEGSTVFVEVSAKKRLNLDLLLEMICLVSDIKAPMSTPGRSAVGTVLEAKLDRGRGAVATVLVQNGTLKNQDNFVVGNTFGKIRAMFDDRGRSVEEAGPSTPVEILGLEAMPDAGDTFLVVSDRDKARGIGQYRKMREREAQLAKSSRVTLEGLADKIKEAGIKELPLILKGDVTGS